MKNLKHLSLACVSLVAACATTSESHAPADRARSAEALARGLVQEAELRTDMRAVRILVDDVHEAEAAPRSGDVLAEELESGLVLALSQNLHVLDDRLGSPSSPRPSEGDLSPLASSGITHVVFGEYAWRGHEILFSARMVDTRTRLIVAAQRVEIPLESLSERARERPRTVAWMPAPAVPSSESSAAVEVATADVYPRSPALQDPERVEDFESWLARQPVSAQEVEDFETWRARQPEQRAKTVDFESWLAQRDEAASAELPAEARMPWAIYREASHSVQPWRTQTLRELLGIPGP